RWQVANLPHDRHLPPARSLPSVPAVRAVPRAATRSRGVLTMRTCIAAVAAALLAVAALGVQAEDKKDKDGWIDLFNGKDTSGWKLRAEKVTVTKFLDEDGKEIKGAKKAKIDKKDVIVDGKGKEIKGAKAVAETKDNPSGWTVEKG